MVLQEYLRQADVTIEQFAESVKASPSQIYRIKNGECEPLTSLAIRIQEATDNTVTVKDLINDSVN